MTLTKIDYHLLRIVYYGFLIIIIEVASKFNSISLISNVLMLSLVIEFEKMCFGC